MQSEDTHALEQQIARLKSAGANEVLVDVESGSSDSRPNFVKLCKLIENNEVTEVIATRTDRITRKLKTLLHFIELFKDSSVNLRCLDDAVDLRTVGGRLSLNIIGSLAQSETERLSERVLAGLDHMRSEGRMTMSPFGYRQVEGKLHLDIYPIVCMLDDRQEWSRATMAQYLIELFIAEASARKTIKQFNTYFGIQRFTSGSAGRSRWHTLGFGSVSGLTNWLSNPICRGNTYYRKTKELTPNTHPAIISDEQHHKVQDILAKNRKIRGFAKTHVPKHPVQGLVVCQMCNSTCYSATSRSSKRTNHYQYCPKFITRACANKKGIRVEKVEAAIIKSLLEKAEYLANRVDVPLTINSTDNAEVRVLQQQLAALKQLDITNPAILKAVKDIERQILNLQQQSGKQSVDHESKLELLQSVFSDADFYSQLQLSDKIKVFKQLVHRVYVRDGVVESVELNV